MSKKRKRFQTGREIMREYIPDYVPPARVFEDRDQLLNRSGKVAADDLLREFKHRLDQKRLRVAARRRV